jgi:hypothetical protein
MMQTFWTEFSLKQQQPPISHPKSYKHTGPVLKTDAACKLRLNKEREGNTKQLQTMLTQRLNLSLCDCDNKLTRRSSTLLLPTLPQAQHSMPGDMLCYG